MPRLNGGLGVKVLVSEKSVVSAGDRVAGVEDNLKIGQMRRRDLPRVLQIERAVSFSPWKREYFLSEMGLVQTRSYQVARVQAGTVPTVVGYGGVIVIRGRGHVSRLAVAPAWQNRQIGTALLLCLTCEALRRGAKQITLEVGISNKIAQYLYAKFGYRVMGRHRNYYEGERDVNDAIIMTVPEVDAPVSLARLRMLVSSLAGTAVPETSSVYW